MLSEPYRPVNILRLLPIEMRPCLKNANFNYRASCATVGARLAAAAASVFCSNRFLMLPERVEHTVVVDALEYSSL